MYQLLASEHVYTIIDFDNRSWIASGNDLSNWYPSIEETFVKALEQGITDPEDFEDDENDIAMHMYDTVQEYCVAITEDERYANLTYVCSFPTLDFEEFKILYPELLI